MGHGKIAYLGKPGSFSSLAAEGYTAKNGLDLEPVPASTFENLIEKVLKETTLGIVPVDNSCAGIVPALDLILKNSIRIVGEHYLPVRHNLIGWKKEGIDLNGKAVYSHPQALSQCSRFIGEKGLVAKQFSDTAAAVRYVSELKDDERYGAFAIGGEDAAALYGISVLEKNIQTNKRNTTRFLVIRPSEKESFFEEMPLNEGNLKVTVSYEVLPRHLWKVLGKFHEFGYDTQTFHSRPTEEKEGSDRVFNTIFYSDMMASRKVKRPFSSLKKDIESSVKDCRVNLMGIYHAEKINLENYT
jgi:prephenate dehydratase